MGKINILEHISHTPMKMLAENIEKLTLNVMEERIKKYIDILSDNPSWKNSHKFFYLKLAPLTGY